jgi:hypothetical protein
MVDSFNIQPSLDHLIMKYEDLEEMMFGLSRCSAREDKNIRRNLGNYGDTQTSDEMKDIMNWCIF